MKLQHLKLAVTVLVVFNFNSPAEAISPLKGPPLCDPEIIRSTSGGAKNYDWEVLADWQLAISEEKGGFVVSGARARAQVITDGTVDLRGDIAKLLKASAKVAHINMWNISIRHDRECVRFLALNRASKF